jgi:hypothetical protein
VVYEAAYLIYSTLFLAIWVVLFIARRDLRAKMLLSSLLIAPLGPISEIWYLRDYWHPPTITEYFIAIEDLIFSFALGGVTFSLYKFFFHTTFTLGSPWPRRHWLMVLFAAMVLAFLLFLTELLHLNSIFSSSFAFIAFAGFVWTLRPDLIQPSIASALLTFVLFLIIYQIMGLLFPNLSQEWCTGCNPTGLRILGVNAEELLWDFSWGLVGGILYEAVTGRAFTKRIEARIES